jgi:putative endonuclease
MEYFWTYMLRCSDGSYYVGHTDNIEKRIAEHKFRKYCDYTSRRCPIEVVFCQQMPSREEAFALERKLKGWKRAKKEALIAGNWPLIKKLANEK